ncbi:hypothetical protein NPIL_131641 [Nephila pilipes]|uniref:Uncharacterized protein n=1 Tax=Nephila pilipes TaxID=299642 RepID=A0A8X6QF49_NEPPI|nr:hypothetical protein NPIL_131641 [Nephila pilipes]
MLGTFRFSVQEHGTKNNHNNRRECVKQKTLCCGRFHALFFSKMAEKKHVGVVHHVISCSPVATALSRVMDVPRFNTKMAAAADKNISWR